MVGSVTSNVPYSYLNVLNPAAAAPVTAPAPAATTTTDDTDTTDNATTDGGLQLPPLVLSLLQGLNPNASNQTSALLGTSNSSESGLLSSAYAQMVTTAYQSVQDKAVASNAAVDPLQNILDSFEAAVTTPATDDTSLI